MDHFHPSHLHICECSVIFLILFLSVANKTNFVEMAHDFFNNNPSYNFKVVGGIISPVSDGYGKSSLISASHRLEMCRLACENHPFIGVESFEALNSEWTPTLTAVKYYDEEIKRDPDCSKVKLMLLIGSDLVDGFRDAHIWNEDELKELISSFG